jgi:hypothetical protein
VCACAQPPILPRALPIHRLQSFKLKHAMGDATDQVIAPTWIKMGRHPFVVALFVANLDVFFHFTYF